MININKLKKAFTLVELLIVIGLLGAIALIVIAAINPIEQANRARDTRFKADGGQLISAIDRYFTARSEFPWITSGTATSLDESFGFISAISADVGICAAAGCTADGYLLSTNELKSEFRNRDFIQNSTNLDQQIMIGKDAGSSSSVYACFIPLAKATRERSVADSKVYTLAADGTRTATTACDVATANWVTSACYVCIPE